MLSDRQRLSGTYWWVRDVFPFDPTVAGELTDSNDRLQRGGGVRLNYDFTVSASILNHLGTGYVRRDASRPEGSSIYPTETVGNQILGIPNLANLPGWPCFAFSGYATLGNLCGAPLDEISTNWAIVDDLSWLKGKHLLKFGVDVRFNRAYDIYQNPAGGRFTFSRNETTLPNVSNSGRLGDAFASALLGQVDSATRKVGILAARYRSPYWGFYLQDQYHATKKLTISYGVRIDRPRTFYETQDQLSTLSLTTPNPGAGGRLGALVFAGEGPGRFGSRSLAPSYYEWGPRLGLAYSLNSKTVIRAGVGIFYAPSNGNLIDTTVIGSLTDGYEFTQTVSSTNNGVSPGIILSQGFPAYTGSIPNLSPSLKNGSTIGWFNTSGGHSAYTSTWNFSIQRQLPSNIVIDVTYVGNKGTHLSSSLNNLNQVNPSYLSLGGLLTASVTSPAAIAAGIQLPYPGFTGSVAQALRAYPQYTTITPWADGVGDSSYEALQVKVQKRFSHGLSFLLSYTHSKWITDTQETVSGFSSFPTDTYNRRIDKSVAPNYSPNVFVPSFVYELPFGPGKAYLNSPGFSSWIVGGWQVSGMLQYQSGTPIAVGGGSGLPIFNGANHPNLVAGVPIRTDVSAGGFDPTRDLYLNANAFAQPPLYTFGNVPRYLPNVRGFAFLNESLVLIKNFFVREGMRFELRGEFFNAFNRVVFSNPSANINSPLTFGKVSGQLNQPRVIQVALKSHF
jgi:hypothetical protein